METQELWFFVSLLTIALAASVSFVGCATYVPIQKFPSGIRDVASFWYQKLYILFVLSLFTSIVGLGIYISLSYDLLKSQNIQEIFRSVSFVLYILSFFFVTLWFKKQTLSFWKLAFHVFLASIVLVITTQENVFSFLRYFYIILLLALFAIVRYGVNVFIKKI